MIEEFYEKYKWHILAAYVLGVWVTFAIVYGIGLNTGYYPDNFKVFIISMIWPVYWFFKTASLIGWAIAWLT